MSKRLASVLLLLVLAHCQPAYALEVEDWSVTDANNNAAPPEGAPEGWSSTTVNNWARATMGKIRRWYQDPEFLKLTGASVVTRIDADTIRIAGTDYTSIFTQDRALLICDNASNCAIGFVSTAAFSAGNTNVDVRFDFGESVPVGTDRVRLHIASNLGSAAFHNWEQVALDDSWAKKTTADQAFTAVGPTAVTSVGATSTLNIAGADGVKDFELYGVIEFTTNMVGGLGLCSFNVHIGTNGTTADAIIYTRTELSAGDLNASEINLSGIRVDDPATNSKMTLSVGEADDDTCTVLGSGTLPTRYSRWGIRERRVN